MSNEFICIFLIIPDNKFDELVGVGRGIIQQPRTLLIITKQKKYTIYYNNKNKYRNYKGRYIGITSHCLSPAGYRRG